MPHQYSQCFDLFSGSGDHGRYKRQTGSNTACAVYAIADYRYFQHMGQSNMFTTAENIVSFTFYHSLCVKNDPFPSLAWFLSERLKLID